MGGVKKKSRTSVRHPQLGLQLRCAGHNLDGPGGDALSPHCHLCERKKVVQEGDHPGLRALWHAKGTSSVIVLTMW